MPLVIPPLTDSEALLSTLSHIDGLLLSGGADINPLYAGEQPSPRLGGINSERDLPELLITRLAFNRQLPILGICRGVQTMAVALDGNVAQDISDTQQVKHSQDADRSDATHTVSVDNESILSGLYHDCFMANEGKQAVLYVNSFHHQAVSEPGPHFRVTARATDGIIEAIESSEQKPLLGVQWHPECMGEEGLPLFRWLVAEARAYREARQLHDRILTLDTHCDTPMFFPQNIDFGTRDERILVSLPRMQEGGLYPTDDAGVGVRLCQRHLRQDWKHRRQTQRPAGTGPHARRTFAKQAGWQEEHHARHRERKGTGRQPGQRAALCRARRGLYHALP